MNKKLVISTCTGCCYYSNRYYSYDNECLLLKNEDGQPLNVGNPNGPIPDECPLPDIDEKDIREVLGKEGVDG